MISIRKHVCLGLTSSVATALLGYLAYAADPKLQSEPVKTHRTLPLPGDAVRSRSWNIRLFTSEDSLPANRGTPIIVGLRNETPSVREVSNAVEVIAVPKGDDTAIGSATTMPTTLPVANGPVRPLRIVVRVAGEHSATSLPNVPVRNLHLENVKFAQDDHRLFSTSITGGVMQKGKYEIEAMLLDGDKVVARSKTRTVTIVRND